MDIYHKYDTIKRNGEIACQSINNASVTTRVGDLPAYLYYYKNPTFVVNKLILDECSAMQQGVTQ